ncbi:hypothetical protein D9M68_747370 [compost metagenome]
MKKITYLAMAALFVAAVQSCGNRTTDSTEMADSANEAKADMDTLVNPVMTVNENDADFAVKAADGGMAEVELGKLAQEMGSDTRVKDFGKMMVNDHSTVNEELKSIAGSKNISLPNEPSEENRKMKEDLMKKQGNDFDRAYIDEMVKGHKKTIKLFEDAQKDLKDPDLKALVDKTLPSLRTHLTHIENLQSQKK